MDFAMKLEAVLKEKQPSVFFDYVDPASGILVKLIFLTHYADEL